MDGFLVSCPRRPIREGFVAARPSAKVERRVPRYISIQILSEVLDHYSAGAHKA
jgi:hypothetical protein